MNALLPPLALKWASTQDDVAQALRVVGALEGGRQGVAEGRAIAERILKALDERGLEAFPSLQEGTTRAEAVANALASAQATLDTAEIDALDPLLTHEERLELGQIQACRPSAAPASARSPPRRRRSAPGEPGCRTGWTPWTGRPSGWATDLQSMNAMLVATQKWVADTRETRRDGPEDEKQFTERLLSEERSLKALEQEVGQLRGELVAERGLVDTTLSGEDAIRKEMAAASSRSRGLLSGVEGRATGDAAQFVRADRRAARRDRHPGAAHRRRPGRPARAGAAEGRGDPREGPGRGKLLDVYGKDVGVVSGDAQQLVGRMAYDSFRRVRRQFYDLVLKADVGVVDTAFTKKQSQTTSIQKVASQKDEELRELD